MQNNLLKILFDDFGNHDDDDDDEDDVDVDDLKFRTSHYCCRQNGNLKKRKKKQIIDIDMFDYWEKG
ncbi:hypothetical protein DERF_004909 [Dermatophagoides farinae]|uniref:Uncharacterized protein n=1 Tax=Dermatophagoides farinae TaxID=6954 RepID=A0A922I5R6_DERFA|nr:hypothetical protein DERF_004909 [Dermatophagoides farinae]